MIVVKSPFDVGEIFTPKKKVISNIYTGYRSESITHSYMVTEEKITNRGREYTIATQLCNKNDRVHVKKGCGTIHNRPTCKKCRSIYLNIRVDRGGYYL